MTSRAYVFTIANPTTSVEELQLPFHGRYVIIGVEVGAGGLPHWQGYIELSQPVRMIHLQSWLRGHYEARHGTRERARAYCMKGSQTHAEWNESHEAGAHYGVDSDIHELGVWNEHGAGNRSDLKELTDALLEGKSMAEVSLINPSTWVRNYRGLAAFEAMHVVIPTMREVKVLLFYGPSGFGKTYKALEMYPKLFKKPIGKALWFDGYNGEEVVLIDEFKGQYALTDMLQILDRYTCAVEIKGGHVTLSCSTIILTTTVHPSTMYPDKDGVPYGNRTGSYAELQRRITKVRLFTAYEQSHILNSSDRRSFFNTPGWTYLKPERPSLGRQDATFFTTDKGRVVPVISID